MYCMHGYTWTVYYTGILNLRCDWYVYMVVKTNRELAVKLMDLQRKWQKGCESIEELQEIVGKEQFYNSLKLRIMERRPKTCVEAGEFADEYEQARLQEPGQGKTVV